MAMTPFTIPLRKDDEITLQYLGAAVVLHWSELPAATQQAILQRAESVGALPPVTSLHEQIKSLIRRTEKGK
jgi:hypothetical protein